MEGVLQSEQKPQGDLRLPKDKGPPTSSGHLKLKRIPSSKRELSKGKRIVREVPKCSKEGE